MAPSLQSIFSTTSSATGRVEKATSRLLISPDWKLNADICNSINSDPWEAKAFVKAVKMRLQNKNSKVQFLALTLLETMIKNCDDFVHFQVVERGVLPEMVKIVRKSKNMQIREKILALLESWQESFRGPDGRYPQFYNTYAELKRSGVQFPGNQENADLKLTLTGPISNQPQIDYKIPDKTIGRLHEVMASETGHFSLSDLYNIRSVMELFTNMLQAVNPNDHKAIVDEVIIDLAKQCDINRKKLMRLIDSTKDDRLLVEALTLNDSLQTVLSKHDALVSRSSLPPETAHALPPAPAVSYQFEDKEEEEDGFSALAKRKSMFKSTGVEDTSSSRSGVATGTSAKIFSEGFTSVASNALALLDPPAPVSSSKKEEDMIDLLSLTLSENQSPQTPSLLPPPLNENQNPFSDSLSWEHYLSYPQPLMSNEGYNSYHSYIAPWARPAVTQSPEISPLFPQQVQQYSSNYLPSSGTATEGSSNPFLSSTYIQHPTSQPISSIQKFSSFNSKEAQVHVDLMQTVPSNAPRSHMSYNAFEIL